MRPGRPRSQAAALSGSLGLAGSIDAGEAACAAQAQHGSAPDMAGKGIANPTSLTLSAAMLLDWRGRRDGHARLCEAAERIEQATEAALANPATRTPDLGGPLGTDGFAEAVAAALCAGGAGTAA